jgi:hypothetical protein
VRSSDGNLWAVWEMHRDEAFACTPLTARPFLLAF